MEGKNRKGECSGHGEQKREASEKLAVGSAQCARHDGDSWCFAHISGVQRCWTAGMVNIDPGVKIHMHISVC